MEETLVIVKPDAVGRGLVGEIISRLERAGFEIVRMRYENPARELIEHFYQEHREKPHFPRLVEYMASGPSCFIRLRRDDAVQRARSLVGDTDPTCARPGTIRGDLGLGLPRNTVHAADCSDAAAREIELIFGHRPDGAQE
jgi:nucleoside-diphosphate kinase